MYDTFNELIQVTLGDIGKSDGDTVERVKRNLNRGEEWLCNKKAWHFLRDLDNSFSTVAGTEEYTLTETDIKKIYNAEITTAGYESIIEFLPYRRYKERWPSVVTADDRGQPNEYTLTTRSSTFQPLMRLHWVPDRVYAIRYDYIKVRPTMDQEADVPTLPPSYRYLLVEFAKWKEWEKDRMDDARTSQSEFLTGYRDMLADYQFDESEEQIEVSY